VSQTGGLWAADAGPAGVKLLADLDALNAARLCAPCPPTRERLDEATIAAIKKIPAVAIGIPRARVIVACVTP
jgi:hypothetical protein